MSGPMHTQKALLNHTTKAVKFVLGYITNNHNIIYIKLFSQLNMHVDNKDTLIMQHKEVNHFNIVDLSYNMGSKYD